MPDDASLSQIIDHARQQQADGRMADALILWRQVLSFAPDHIEALHMAGICCHQVDMAEEAQILLRQAMTLAPDDPFIRYNLALSMMAATKLHDAETLLTGIASRLSDQPQFHLVLGSCYLQQNSIESAIHSFDTALKLAPNLAEARYNRGLTYLLTGDWEAGWQDWEARWQSSQFTSPVRTFDCPQWQGESLDKLHLHIHAEQGLGDCLQMARYLPLVTARHISVEVKPPLLALFTNSFPDLEILPIGTTPAHKPDRHIPMMSLPGLFNTRPDTVPIAFAPAGTASNIRDGSSPLKVGLVWAGNAHHPRDAARSMPLSALRPLRGVENVDFYSFQTGPLARDARYGSWKRQIVDLSPDLSDFTDTVAALNDIDLLVTVDTAIAHLAAGMDIPTWMMISHHPDWRWMLDRTDSPWYPSMRLFRQPVPGAWDNVVADIAKALSAFTAAKL